MRLLRRDYQQWLFFDRCSCNDRCSSSIDLCFSCVSLSFRSNVVIYLDSLSFSKSHLLSFVFMFHKSFLIVWRFTKAIAFHILRCCIIICRSTIACVTLRYVSSSNLFVAYFLLINVLLSADRHYVHLYRLYSIQSTRLEITLRWRSHFTSAVRHGLEISSVV